MTDRRKTRAKNNVNKNNANKTGTGRTRTPDRDRRKKKTSQKATRAPSSKPTPETPDAQSRTRATGGPKKTGRNPRRRQPGPKKSRASDHPDSGAGAEPERLQKLLARAGLGSRRALEQRIEAGDVKVNGRRAELGQQVAPGDRVAFEGLNYLVQALRPTHHTLIYNKPEGEVTTRRDPEGRRTVFDRLPRPPEGRWIAVGRLDINTSGLLLLTTDGELAHRMMHPSGKVDREYLCRIRGEVADADLERLMNGVELEDGPARFSDLVIGEHTAGHTWYTVAIMEGRNREVRRLWEAVGATVARLKRVRFGPVFLPEKLKPGAYRRLSVSDHRVLRQDVGLPGTGRELGLEAR